MAEPLAVPKRRHLFIDLYRSAVILLMLEGHVFRTFLPPDVQQTPFFQFHEFFHGLSAPAFLFGAGLTFVISTRKRWESYHHWDEPLARRVRRLLLVLCLGLGLHLPYFSFRKILLEGTHDEILQFFRFDVLHCIGVGLLLLHALVFFFKTEVRFYGLVLATTVTVCFATPLMWDVDVVRMLPVPIAQALSGSHGSLFPLFPYVGFLFAGVIVSWEYLIASEQRRERLFMQKLLTIGASLIIVGILSDVVPIRIYPHYNFWFTSPSYFLIRVGALMMVVAAFWYAAARTVAPKKVLTVLGIESLFVYVLHLLILYGSAMNPAFNLQVILGNNLTVLQTMGVFIGVLLTILAVALAWNFLKRIHPNFYRIVLLAGTAIFLYQFFTRDF
ncbi:MAG: DUF1624 domain-containing protein [Ignavibacteriae bacterium]|nr:DUF1624 domain-containing protein [Ignavibacteria bacterium]MBI3363276.1 DUF1624 domain-containing protein [Ignavibacteriota bacterium]